MIKGMRRVLAEKRRFRTASDFDLLLEKNWISDVEDCELLSTLISRCIKEKGLVYTNGLLGENDTVLDRVGAVDKELAYRVKSGNLLSEFVILGDELVLEIGSLIRGIQNHALEVLGASVCCIEDKDDNVLMKYTIDSVERIHCLGEGNDSVLDALLESTLGLLLDCMPVAVKRLYFPTGERVSVGYMNSSEEEGSYEVHLE